MNKRSTRLADHRQQIAATILPLYAAGLGTKLIAKQTGFSPRIVRTVLIEQRVYQPGKLRPLPGRGVKMRQRKVATQIRKMKFRAKKCLSIKAPRQRSPTAGMSEAQRFKWKYDNVPEFRLKHLMRRRMRKVIIEGIKKPKGRCLALIGSSMAHLRNHIERQFRPGMTWSNHGVGRGKWAVDHIIPCAAFDLTRVEQQRVCFHWTNLRPLWSTANARKHDRFNPATPCFL